MQYVLTMKNNSTIIIDKDLTNAFQANDLLPAIK